MKPITVDHKEYNVGETKAAEISNMFKPMLDKMVGLEGEFNKIQQKPLDLKTCKEARELRLRYVKTRTGTAEVHKKMKAFYLNGGKLVDGWKTAQKVASEGIEEKLLKIEKHFENIELERIKKEAEQAEILQGERFAELQKYGAKELVIGLGSMSDDVWANLLSGTKTAYETEQKRIAEEQRIAEEDAKERQRISDLHESRKRSVLHLWNYLEDGIKGKSFGEIKESDWEFILIAARAKKQGEENKAKAAKLEKAKTDKKNKELADKNAKLQKELKAKKEAADKIENDRIEVERIAKEKEETENRAIELKAKKAASAPDKDKLKDLLNRVDIELYMPELTTKEGAACLILIEDQLRKLKNVITNEISKL